LLDGFVAEPPVHFLSTDEGLDLIFGVGMENSAGDPPGNTARIFSSSFKSATILNEADMIT